MSGICKCEFRSDAWRCDRSNKIDWLLLLIAKIVPTTNRLNISGKLDKLSLKVT